MKKRKKRENKEEWYIKEHSERCTETSKKNSKKGKVSPEVSQISVGVCGLLEGPFPLIDTQVVAVTINYLKKDFMTFIFKKKINFILQSISENVSNAGRGSRWLTWSLRLNFDTDSTLTSSDLQ